MIYEYEKKGIHMKTILLSWKDLSTYIKKKKKIVAKLNISKIKRRVMEVIKL